MRYYVEITSPNHFVVIDYEKKMFKTDDLRSYHISSKKINKILKFEPKNTIEDAIGDLKKAFDTVNHKILLTKQHYN